MGDIGKRIEGFALLNCPAIRFIRLSKTLGTIGEYEYCGFYSLKAFFFPSTLKSIELWAFSGCPSLRLLILPPGIDPNNVGKDIITALAGLGISDNYFTHESNDRQVNEWLLEFVI